MSTVLLIGTLDTKGKSTPLCVPSFKSADTTF